MSKSLKNFYTLEDIKQKGFEPLALRYLFLTGHYRDELKFSWESLQAAQNALNTLRGNIRNFAANSEQRTVNSELFGKFLDALNNDLNTPQALAALHELIKSDLSDSEKAATVLKMDQILGLGLDEYVGKNLEIPEKVKELVEQREQARKAKDFRKSDEIRNKIKDLGFELEDSPTGPKIKKLS